MADLELDAATYRGQRIYSALGLRFYDALVVHLSNRYIWRCPAAALLGLYDANVGARHLDVGVGTGYYLDRCHFPVARPSITLFDANAQALAFTARRIRRYAPKVVQGNVLQPSALAETYDSIGMSYLLHCVPGDLSRKAVAFAHSKANLAPGGRLFGATLLHDGVEQTPLSRRLMRFYNRTGVFDNERDNLTALQRALGAYFAHVDVKTVGSAALFVAHD